eukprot:TRINITY_DN16300_c1_g1_i2.p1 TRINITY_DN16300_c1_g1~~TRINITY_DN16300_c1_g1_i2.p1  ORF type:complete len:117 (-),score=9.22 TRINITY_DN16300_c1_g1_i2:421-771(-)
MSSLSMFMAALICTNDSNTRIWRHCPSGVFSVKSFLKASISQSKSAPPGTAAWRGHTPSRMEMFTWFAIERYIYIYIYRLTTISDIRYLLISTQKLVCCVGWRRKDHLLNSVKPFS